MIRLSAILVLLSLSANVFATGLGVEEDKSKQDFTYGKHTTPGSSAEESPTGDLEPRDPKNPGQPTKPEKEKVESDSSNYSVNKFNFLFYFVYKLKYLDDDYDTEDSDTTTDR